MAKLSFPRLAPNRKKEVDPGKADFVKNARAGAKELLEDLRNSIFIRTWKKC